MDSIDCNGRKMDDTKRTNENKKKIPTKYTLNLLKRSTEEEKKNVEAKQNYIDTFTENYIRKVYLISVWANNEGTDEKAKKYNESQ